MLSGTFGPFRAGSKIVVPLWLGLKLKERKQCLIEIPRWMLVDYKGNLNTVTCYLPDLYEQISKLLLNCCFDQYSSNLEVYERYRILDYLREIHFDRYLDNQKRFTETGSIEEFLRQPRLEAKFS